MSISCAKIEDIELIKKVVLFGARDFVLANVVPSIRRELPFPIDYNFTPCFLPYKFERMSDAIWNFGIRSDDIWIITFPKAGTTWISNIVWKLINNLDYSMKFVSPSKNFFEGAAFLDKIEDENNNETYKNAMNDADLQMYCLENENSPRMIKSHLPAHLLPKDIWSIKPKMIYVYRNAKDVAISMYHMFHSFPNLNYQGSMEDFFEDFLNDHVAYAPFRDHIKGFQQLNRYFDNILLINYDKMIGNSFHEIKRISEFLGYNYTDKQLECLEEHVSFNNMSNTSQFEQSFLLNRIKFIRKGKSGGYRDEMSSHYIARFNEWEK